MTREQALDILCAFNAWRRYDGPVGEGPLMPTPKEIGLALDLAIDILRSKEVPSQECREYTIEDLKQMELMHEENPYMRAVRTCYGVGIYTVYELAGWPRFELMSLRGLGKHQFAWLDAVLKKYGLRWGMWESDSYKDYKQLSHEAV